MNGRSPSARWAASNRLSPTFRPAWGHDRDNALGALKLGGHDAPHGRSAALQLGARGVQPAHGSVDLHGRRVGTGVFRVDSAGLFDQCEPLGAVAFEVRNARTEQRLLDAQLEGQFGAKRIEHRAGEVRTPLVDEVTNIDHLGLHQPAHGRRGDRRVVGRTTVGWIGATTGSEERDEADGGPRETAGGAGMDAEEFHRVRGSPPWARFRRTQTCEVTLGKRSGGYSDRYARCPGRSNVGRFKSA